MHATLYHVRASSYEQCSTGNSFWNLESCRLKSVDLGIPGVNETRPAGTH